MPEEFEVGMILQMLDILLRAGEQVVNAQDFVAVAQQPIAQMRPQEAGASGHHDALAQTIRRLPHWPILRSN